MMNCSKAYSAAWIGGPPRRGPPRCAVQWFLSPHHALSLGERVNHPLCGEQSRLIGFLLRDARCSLSLRERVRVRGNDLNYHLEYQTFHVTFELGDSSGRARGFLKCL